MASAWCCSTSFFAYLGLSRTAENQASRRPRPSSMPPSASNSSPSARREAEFPARTGFIVTDKNVHRCLPQGPCPARARVAPVSTALQPKQAFHGDANASTYELPPWRPCGRVRGSARRWPYETDHISVPWRGRRRPPKHSTFLHHIFIRLNTFSVIQSTGSPVPLEFIILGAAPSSLRIIHPLYRCGPLPC